MTAAKPYPILNEFSNIKLSSPIITNNTIKTGNGDTPATITIPSVDATLATTTTEQTFTHKTLTAPILNGAIVTYGQLLTSTGSSQATITLPTETSSLATVETEQTLTNKRFDGTSRAVVKDASPSTWTKIGPQIDATGLARKEGKLIALTTSGVRYLDDGEWHNDATVPTLENDEELKGIIATDSQFVLWSQTRYFTSTDGREFTAPSATVPSGATILGMHYGNSTLYMFGRVGPAGDDGTTYHVWYLDESTSTWAALAPREGTLPTTDEIKFICAINGGVLVGHKGSVWYVFDDVATEVERANNRDPVAAVWMGTVYLLRDEDNNLYTYKPGDTSIVALDRQLDGQTFLAGGNEMALVKNNESVSSIQLDVAGTELLPDAPTLGETGAIAIYTNNRYDLVATDGVYRSNICGKISIKFDEMADFFLSSGGGDNNTKYIIQLMRYIAYKFSGSGLDLSDIFNYVDPDDELDAQIADTSQGHGAGGLS